MIWYGGMYASQLLQKDPKQRLGCSSSGAKEVKEHGLYKGIVWKRLEAGIMEPLFLPDVSIAWYMMGSNWC